MENCSVKARERVIKEEKEEERRGGRKGDFTKEINVLCGQGVKDGNI